MMGRMGNRARRAALHMVLISVAASGLAACQTTTGGTEVSQAADLPPPYPPGYMPYTKRLPDQIQQSLPSDIPPEQVLLADDGCFYYHRGALTYPILDAAATSRLCIVVERVEQPVDLTGVRLGPVPASSRL